MKKLLRLLPCGAAVYVLSLNVMAGEIGFIEDFSLAVERSVPLGQLIPGTEDFYYYSCLDHQNNGRLAEVEKLLPDWSKKCGETTRVREIRNRQEMLSYEADPQKSLGYLTRVLGLNFNHQKEVLDAQVKLPTSLDPLKVGSEAFMKEALARYPNSLEGFTDAGLALLDPAALDPVRRRDFLRRLASPDAAGLADAVVADLRHKDSGGFGSLEIHKRLTLDQMEKCAAAIPELRNQQNFVDFYLVRLRPVRLGWEERLDERTAYLDRLWNFVKALDPSHNSLKANVLYHRLKVDMEAGVFDKDRFMEYVKLPRRAPFVRQEYLRTADPQGRAANLGQDFSGQTGFGIIGDENLLLRHFLLHFLSAAEKYDDFATYLDDKMVKRTFAEAKIRDGIGDQAQWFAMLSPAEHQALKERVDIDLAPTNKRFFTGDEPVVLDVATKNVATLVVKTYAVNLSNFYKDKRTEPGLDIDLDGVVPNEEKAYEYKDSEFRSIPRKFDFPSLKGRGAYVVEFVGNGKVSRALVRKGSLQCVTTCTAAGHLFRVVDEAGTIVAKPSVWLDGHLYEADKEGVLVVPYSNEPKTQKVVLYSGDFCSLAEFSQKAECYSLRCGVSLDRESLVSGNKAQAAIHVNLSVNGEEAPLKLLKNVKLIITSHLIDNSSSVKTVEDVEFASDSETVYEFLVPEGLRGVDFKLEADVANLSQGKDEHLACGKNFQLNGIDGTTQISEMLLSREGGDYVLRLLGKNGEPMPDRAANLEIRRKYFSFPVNDSLKTDAQGCVKLGKVEGATLLARSGEAAGSWTLGGGDAALIPESVTCAAGKELAVPCAGRVGDLGGKAVSLLACNGPQLYLADHTDKLVVKDGCERSAAMPDGDYVLRFKETGETLSVRVFDGAEKDGLIISRNCVAAVSGASALGIASLKVENGARIVGVANAAADTRVHVFCDRFVPLYNIFADCGAAMPPTGPTVFRFSPESFYESGRTASEEYEYILRRRYSEKFAGALMERPSLLLNPFALKKTEVQKEREARGGEGFAAAKGEAREDMMRKVKCMTDRGAGRGMGNIAALPTLDFLVHPAAVVMNLRPDKDGNVTLPMDKLGDRQSVCVLALGSNGASMKSLSFPAKKLETKDMRMAKTLDPARHFIEVKKISTMKPGDKLEIKDFASARYEVYDTVGKLFNLYAAIAAAPAPGCPPADSDGRLAEFSFLKNWGRLGDEAKLEKYSKFACHELSFFLYCKDRPFFDKVVMPYVANKRDKTFMDDFLVGNALDAYLVPAVYRDRLNAVEKALLVSKLKGEFEPTVRFLNELLELVPPNPEKGDHLFRMSLSATAGESTEGGEANGLGAADKAAAVGNVVFGAAETDAAVAAAPMPSMKLEKAAAAPGAKPMAPPPPQEAQMKKKQSLDALADKKGGGVRALRLADSAVMEKRKTVEQLFRKLEKTEELAENNYYKLPFERQNAALVPVNGFWLDFAGASGALVGFRSPRVAEASSSFTDMALALAVIDLPFKAEKHDMKIDGTSLAITAASPAILFHRELVEVQPAAGRRPVLLAQNYFKESDRYEFEGPQQIDKFVKGEFVSGGVYGCMVVVTNPGSAPMRLELITQIPAGAIPVAGTAKTDSKPFVLEGFSTRAIEYRFYFPKAGDFAHYPAHVASEGSLAAFCAPSTMKVVDTAAGPDKKSWEYLSQNGSDDDVLAFLAKRNLNRIALAKIAFRMKDKAFYGKTIELLTKAHAYDDTLWSYAVRHGDLVAMRAYLAHSVLASACGDYLVSAPLVVDPVQTGAFQFLEYSPLVNARVCQLGKRRSILNETQFAQYMRLLKILSYKKSLGDDDRIAVAYHFFLQDRVAEALALLAKIDPAKIPERMQYDYCQAYAALRKGDPDAAVKIVQGYKEYPVVKWRNRFNELLNQAAEAKGASGKLVDKDSRGSQMTSLASQEPTIGVKADEGSVMVEYQNVTRCVVSYYLIDIEFLFSKSPFSDDYGRQFGLVMPNKVVEVELPVGKSALSLEIPKEFASASFLVEVSAAGKKSSAIRFANAMAVGVEENYGQVRVTKRGGAEPLAKVYVKCYAKLKDGATVFHKDGYTDLRGRFDYVTLSADTLDQVEKFSILVMSESDGAVVKEAKPPKR